MPISTVITDVTQVYLWLRSRCVTNDLLSDFEVTDTDAPVVEVEVEAGVAIGVTGLYVTALMVAATWNTDPPPNS